MCQLAFTLISSPLTNKVKTTSLFLNITVRSARIRLYLVPWSVRWLNLWRYIFGRVYVPCIYSLACRKCSRDVFPEPLFSSLCLSIITSVPSTLSPQPRTSYARYTTLVLAITGPSRLRKDRSTTCLVTKLQMVVSIHLPIHSLTSNKLHTRSAARCEPDPYWWEREQLCEYITAQSREWWPQEAAGLRVSVSLTEQARVQKYGDLLLTCAAKGLVLNVQWHHFHTRGRL